MSQTFPPKDDDQRGGRIAPGSLSELWLLDDHHAATARTVEHGESACAASDAPDSVYYVHRGLIKAVRYSESGEEAVIDYYREGSLFGGLSFCGWSLCREGIEREVAIAVEDSAVMVMTFHAFKRHVSERPEALMGLLADYCRRLATARLRIEGFVLYPAEERLARALLMLAANQSDVRDPVTLRRGVTHKELAHLIGISRQLVTKLIGQLRERGFIKSPSAGKLIIYRQKLAQAYTHQKAPANVNASAARS